MEDGIYFGLDFDQYRAVPALSYSGAKDLLISPLTYWANHVDPSRRDEDTGATRIGQAFHTRILEGAAVFAERFAIKPENDGSYIEGIEELRARCKELDLKVGGSTADLCARILAADPSEKLWAKHLENFNAGAEGKSIITAEQWQQVEVPARIISAHPAAGKAFQGGYPEVSILWTDPELQIRCKTRVDYLKIKAALELKTFSNPQELPIDAAVARAVGVRKYHMQARVILDAIGKAKAMATAGKVHGDVDPGWLAEFIATDQTFVWVFIQQGHVPEIRVREFRRTVPGAAEGATETLLWSAGWSAWRVAAERYAECRAHYGDDPETPWMAPDPMRALSDDELPMWALQ